MTLLGLLGPEVNPRILPRMDPVVYLKSPVWDFGGGYESETELNGWWMLRGSVMLLKSIGHVSIYKKINLSKKAAPFW